MLGQIRQIVIVPKIWIQVSKSSRQGGVVASAEQNKITQIIIGRATKYLG